MSEAAQPSASTNGSSRTSDPSDDLINSISGCLDFSHVFALSGYETLNDKILIEMNERARCQRLKESSTAPTKPIAAMNQQASPELKGHRLRPSKSERQPGLLRNSTFSNISSSGSADPKSTGRLRPSGTFEKNLHNLARINRSPPGTRFSSAHRREFAQSAPLNSSPFSKRQSSGDVSPSKRRRDPEGLPVGIVASPTKPLAELNIGSNRMRLEEVSVARQRDRQRKDQQTSPRRLLRPARPIERHEPPPAMPGAFPKLTAEVPAAKTAKDPVRKVRPATLTSSPSLARMSQASSRPARPLPTKPSMSRSQSTRTLSGALGTDAAQTHRIPFAFSDRVPSFARPTQAALRRSQSTSNDLRIDK